MSLEQIRSVCLANHQKNKGQSNELPRFSLFCRDQVSNFETFIYRPVICLILQGEKTISLGNQKFELHEGDALLVSHDLPMTAMIKAASPEEPYLAAILGLDLTLLRSLHSQIGIAEAGATEYALRAEAPDPIWLEPFERYIRLLENPLDREVLAPSIYREIHYRLLQSPIGDALRNLLFVNSKASRIEAALTLLQEDYRAPLNIVALAEIAAMSISAFYESFKCITGTTPLQYQKELRLIRARMMLQSGEKSVSESAFSVGYESLSHFSRDYKRKYGASPSQTRA